MHYSGNIPFSKKFLKRIFTIGLILFATQMSFTQASSDKQVPDSTTKKIFDSRVDKLINYTPTSYPGGDEALVNFIKRNVTYPTKALRKGVEGYNLVKFLINTNGDIEDVSIIKSLDPDCDKEAIRVIRKSGKWIPGMNNGEKINEYFTLPFTFRLRK